MCKGYLKNQIWPYKKQTKQKRKQNKKEKKRKEKKRKEKKRKEKKRKQNTHTPPPHTHTQKGPQCFGAHMALEILGLFQPRTGIF